MAATESFVGRMARLVMMAVIGGAVGTAAFGAPPPAPSPAGAEEFPDLAAVRAAITGHFNSLADHQAGDLLTQRDVVPIFRALAKLGWTVADEKEIVDQVLPDNDSLAAQLRTPAGRKFMRHMATIPEGYDRLDRLRRMPDGSRQVRELIKGPDGHKMIEYLATTKEGSNLGKSLSRAPRGAKFNRPTDRLYTATDVLTRLERSYAAELARRAAQ